MKNINFVKITALLIVIGLCGCKKLLKENNPSGTTAETVYTTAPGFETLVNASYSYTKSWYGKEDGFGLSEVGTDIWTAGSESYGATSGLVGGNTPLVLYQNLNPVNTNVTRLWKQLYAAVNLCNIGIKISEDGSFTPPVSSVAELRFLRAFYYWHIVETWGDVHFSKDPSEGANLKANKTPVAVFYETIISDLEQAIAGLPDGPSKINGKVNKQIAQAFLARVYLTKAYKDPSYFPLAKKLADDVIASGKYNLVNSYVNLWDMTQQKINTASGNEVIWSVNYTLPTVITDQYEKTSRPFGYGVDIFAASGNPTSDRGNNNGHLLFVPRYDFAQPPFLDIKILNRDVRNGWSFARFKPTRFLLDLFDETKDSRYKGSFQTTWKLNMPVTTGVLKGKIPYRDTALVITKNPKVSTKYYTVNVYDTYNSDGSRKVLNGPENALFPSLLKHRDSTRSASPNDIGTGNVQSQKDVYVLRLAEMYLISAEASIGMSDASSALDKINTLRRKRALPGMESAMEVSADSATLDFVLNERAREFAGEQIRWFDLKRTGTLVKRVKRYNPDAGQYIQEFHNLRPIPQVQLDAITNRDEFYQNFGY